MTNREALCSKTIPSSQKKDTNRAQRMSGVGLFCRYNDTYSHWTQGPETLTEACSDEDDGVVVIKEDNEEAVFKLYP